MSFASIVRRLRNESSMPNSIVNVFATCTPRKVVEIVIEGVAI